MVPYFKNGPNKGKKKEIGITADGSKAKHGTIAADTSIYPFGTKMYVPGYGWGEVHDVGSAIKGNHIDVYIDSHRKAVKWGRQKLWVTVIRE
jgi:3D (Asp-Asp-Asp) domain-containing protein